MAHGWVELRDCVPEVVRTAWIAQALAGIRSAPTDLVKECGPGDPGTDLLCYDPGRPETCRRPLVTFRGDRRFMPREVMPRLWQATCELVGGEERLQAREWSNYLIFANGSRTRLPRWWQRWLQRQGHGIRSAAWHVDAPSPRARLATWRTGLIVLLRFSDVAPWRGATLIAPDSLARIGRRLRAHPDGYDLTRPRLGQEIARECRGFVELSGAAGDAVLMHPWMLHGPSRNLGGGVRVLANPLVYLAQPWRLDRPFGERSPLEHATNRALGC